MAEHPVETRGRGDDDPARIDDREAVVGVLEQELQVVELPRFVPRADWVRVCHRLLCRVSAPCA